MKTFAALICLGVALATASPSGDQRMQGLFAKFEKDFNRKYANEGERLTRFKIFEENVRKIEEHNASGKSWTMGINEFADMTEGEFRNTRLGYYNIKKSVNTKKHDKDIDVSQLPSEVDWREKGAITPVKDQGSCGSCWAFAAVQSIESYGFIETEELKELSPQQITSCTQNPDNCGGSGGCSGSIPQLAFTYTFSFGITSESEYPYESGNSGSTGICSFDPNLQTQEAMVMGWETLVRNDQAVIMDHLANKGPLSVAVDASSWGFYFGGVFDGCDFGSNIGINHAVQLVGYGTDAEGDYWLVRNSWGASWGDSGYIKLKRQATPECGVDSTPLTGVACEGDGQETQDVCGQCGILFDVVYPVGTFYPQP